MVKEETERTMLQECGRAERSPASRWPHLSPLLDLSLSLFLSALHLLAPLPQELYLLLLLSRSRPFRFFFLSCPHFFLLTPLSLAASFAQASLFFSLLLFCSLPLLFASQRRRERERRALLLFLFSRTLTLCFPGSPLRCVCGFAPNLSRAPSHCPPSPSTLSYSSLYLKSTLSFSLSVHRAFSLPRPFVYSSLSRFSLFFPSLSCLQLSLSRLSSFHLRCAPS